MRRGSKMDGRGKRIWIINHYSLSQVMNKGGRHYWFAKNLKNQGYLPCLIGCNVKHNSTGNYIKSSSKWDTIPGEDFPIVFIDSNQYQGNGIARLRNMFYFSFNLFSNYKQIMEKVGKPDLILASSVHPLTILVGQLISKKLRIPCISEVRDLWPESLIAFGNLKRNSPLAKLLFLGEKWLYKRADNLIFTMEGGEKYIQDKGWDTSHGGPIDLSKVTHINNGFDRDTFAYNVNMYEYRDNDLDNDALYKIVYAGAIRKANNLGMILEVAKEISKLGYHNFRFLIFGDGEEKNTLIEKLRSEKIDNVVFKGEIEKKFVSSLVSKADLNLLHVNGSYDIWKYGNSSNKLFEYIAAGKPILSTISPEFDLIKKYKLGRSVSVQTPLEIANAIVKLYEEKGLDTDQANFIQARNDYNFENLTNKLISITDKLIG